MRPTPTDDNDCRGRISRASQARKVARQPARFIVQQATGHGPEVIGWDVVDTFTGAIVVSYCLLKSAGSVNPGDSTLRGARSEARRLNAQARRNDIARAPGTGHCYTCAPGVPAGYRACPACGWAPLLAQLRPSRKP